MSDNPVSVGSEAQALIECETSLLHVRPPAGSRLVSKPRKPLPEMLDDLRIARAIRFMEQGSVQLKDVAEHVGLSLFHFQRYFKDVMGESPAVYLRRVRLDEAAVSLWNNDLHVIELAFTAGYASHEAFVRAFYRQFGLVPTQYRVFSRRASSQPQPEDRARAQSVRVNQLQSLPLLAARFYGPYANIEAHWKRFATVLREAGLPLEKLQAVGIAYDSPEITPNELIRYDCAIVDTGFDPKGAPLTALKIPAATYAMLEHQAPYQEIFATYRVLSITWLVGVANQYVNEVVKAYELYREPPWDNLGQRQRFDLTLPVRKLN
ncbi:AraC family transcriptional regulator [Paraburkholderia phenazinium]|uniref:AraC family transcriptional regulator n=1 Tax=Paraburkholderia phenazinium TaxID=60549 RepID=A0A1G8HFJ6_9BURK|nr:AraC family transcriptional regulator [Paraburkholderia phenazinium]SDI05240.1 AraC family transcriptional regulator [Paraburkholderia phenazinium]